MYMYLILHKVSNFYDTFYYQITQSCFGNGSTFITTEEELQQKKLEV